MGCFDVLRPLIVKGHISTKGNEVTFETRITVSRRFHEGLTAVADNIQQQADFFTSKLTVRGDGDMAGNYCEIDREAQVLRGRHGMERDKSFELQCTRERQMHKFQSIGLVLRPPDRGSVDGQGSELLR